MLASLEQLHKAKASSEIVKAIRFITRAKAVRQHTYRKLAFSKLDEFLENSGV